MEWMKKKKAIEHALVALNYTRFYNGEFFPPEISVAEKLQLLYNYLGLDIIHTPPVTSPKYKIVKGRSTRAKKEKEI